ncbi:ATP-binding protein [Luteimonas sp. TWI1416]|uniref:ATP-binding protein n=1 Tax=unclassified Luteimonas TaxID=2629088 RepID=UPI003207D0EB
MRPKNLDNPIELTDSIRSELPEAFAGSFKINSDSSITREKGYYGTCIAMPSSKLRAVLSIDREILILISTFEDQQTRTIQTAREIIEDPNGRLDSSTFVVIHRDPRGNNKLKKWGREHSLAVLPIYYEGSLPTGDSLLQALAYELYSFDVFDVTGPVADDLQFFGRREEARNLAKKLQTGQIRSCFGIRKIGKTSVLHRVVHEVREHYDCSTFLIDAESDSVFNLRAAQLLNSLASSLERALTKNDGKLVINTEEVEITTSSERLKSAVEKHEKQILFVFDEIDYLTPTSPTAPHWREDFNAFWRNLRAVYQSSAMTSRNLSLLISGVSSKWFSVESIEGIENAALSLVPEEYLSPLPRGAAAAMIRRLGRTAGLAFNDEVADKIAQTCADMPFWIRKACSYIHSKIDVGLRPFEPQVSLINDYLREFIDSDGTAMSEVALAHLFRVYPEVRDPAFACYERGISALPPRMLRVLQKYGIVSSGHTPTISGEMMEAGLKNLSTNRTEEAIRAQPEPPITTDSSNYGEWADELAIISRRRNILERKLRGVVGNFIRFSSMNDSSKSPAKERILKCVDAKRREGLQSSDLDEIMSKLFWLELISVVKKEWELFDKLFGDKATLDKFTTIVNERPDAHAKDIDQFDAALHRNAVGWFEDRLSRI